ncbi:MAG: DUF1003 domain-containing protein [Steroidobacter sp.]
MSDQESMEFMRSAERWFEHPERFGESERRIVTKAAHRLAMAQDPNRKFDSEATLGDRLADRVARFGGSWTFIVAFLIFLVVWALLNSLNRADAVDPYPFVFLNLILSMLAAIQAPIIMMSQNRQAYKDRRMATHDYEINLKAEIEILALHEKLDSLRVHQLQELIVKQQQQLDLLTKLVTQLEGPAKK